MAYSLIKMFFVLAVCFSMTLAHPAPVGPPKEGEGPAGLGLPKGVVPSPGGGADSASDLKTDSTFLFGYYGGGLPYYGGYGRYWGSPYYGRYYSPYYNYW